ncbi:NADH:ubiquinone oxidoreductase subunit NDUFA12 [Sphingomonas sp. ID0503]|uniref:NADH:ubiquinone oxidoreductase subunit NDUFA12 n=1 Tax=Sphingomonas sp. ID0503 TaxID=3399691 RepID=UPI003AFA0405
MSVLSSIFTWWNGATIGTRLFSRRNGEQVGTDALGNVYFQTKAGRKGPARRWVIYSGANDASRIPPEWFSWMHHQIDEAPDQALPPPREWQQPPAPNMTGTAAAYRPSGALEMGGKRAAATGDYEAWSPN